MADGAFAVPWAKLDGHVQEFTEVATVKHFAEERLITGFLKVLNIQLPPIQAQCLAHPRSLVFQNGSNAWICIRGEDDESATCDIHMVKQIHATISYGANSENVIIAHEDVPQLLGTSTDEYYTNFAAYKAKCMRVRCGEYRVVRGKVEECLRGPFDHYNSAFLK
jgi:hypothetical protein